mmetsp:Transcript_32481/g.52613  ORF Transcript_32481/g.52613 Transcript_32481/m.52613 type:complete len:103 (+) Transcript_32481:2158-2466(+)
MVTGGSIVFARRFLAAAARPSKKTRRLISFSRNMELRGRASAGADGESITETSGGVERVATPGGKLEAALCTKAVSASSVAEREAEVEGGNVRGEITITVAF